MPLDLTLLTSAYDHGRKALESMNTGKRFTAVSYAGKATDCLGQFGALAANEDGTPGPVLMATSPDANAVAMDDETLLDTIKMQIDEAAEPAPVGASSDANVTAIGPGLQMLITVLIERLLKRLFPTP